MAKPKSKTVIDFKNSEQYSKLRESLVNQISDSKGNAPEYD